MKKNIIKIIVGISTIILVAIVLVVINNSYAPKKEQPKDEILYKDSKIKQLNLWNLNQLMQFAFIIKVPMKI